MSKIDKLDLDEICMTYEDDNNNTIHTQPNIFAIIEKINEIIEVLNERDKSCSKR